MISANTIFKHLFIRMAVILLGISVIFSIALVPIYQDKLLRMLAAQGNTFANTTIAACREALYTKDFSFVINYVNKVLRQTPEITFVTLVSREGMRLNLTGKGWSVDNLSNSAALTPYAEGSEYNIMHARELQERQIDSAFLFTKPVDITGFRWGQIELGISDTEYTALMGSYFRNVLLSSAILVVISLMILHGVSSKLAQQLARLRSTALALSKGDLSARAPTESIGEIQLLATTLNGMAESLDNNTRRARKLARLVEDTNDAIAIFGDDERISFVNPTLMEITGHSVDFYNGMSLHELFEHLGVSKAKQREVSTIRSSMEQLDWSTDITLSALNGELMHMIMRIEAFEDENPLHNSFFIVLSDITRRKQLEFELESLAYFDKLTKLPNRRYFTDRLSEAVKETGIFGNQLAVFFLDLDNFKIINDSLGHEVGDFVLREAAWRIQDTLRSDDIVCRLGGDEFTIIIKGEQQTKELATIASAIIEEFSKPFVYRERELRIGTSIGIVQYPDDGRDYKELIKNADTAMYAAKHAGKNAYRFFTQDMHQDLHDYMELESDLRKAIDNSDLHLVYQPIINVETQKITNCEALLRWRHPERGYVPPTHFIPIAEQSGLISAIGNRVFTEVCKQLKQWDFNINVSINISGSELLEKAFLKRLQQTLIEYGIEAHRIQLEFTEHVLVSKDGSNLPILNALKRAGFRIALDDFGTGFSSLSYLTELPVDVIKIDKAFISKLPHDRRTIAVVNAIISLADNLDMITIGEGAEHKSQVDWLHAHGCKTIQGYYFHKPMPAMELERLMSQESVYRLPVATPTPIRKK